MWWKFLISLPMNPPYRANNTGTYIRKDVFEAKHIKTFTLKNLKKMNELRLGNIWRAKKMPDTIKCYTEDSGVDGYVKVPVGIRSYIPEQFTNDYHDNKVVSHPPLSRQSYDYQSSAVQDLMMSSVWLLWASTGSGKTQMICDITVRAQRRTLIMVQNLTQMSQMVDDIFTILWVTPTQVSGANVSKRNRMTFDDRITVCSIDSRDKINAKEYGLIILDECDTYLWSDARREWVGSLSPEFLYWLTGLFETNSWLTQKQQVLAMLQSWKELEPKDFINARILRYGAHIFNLRKEGHQITTRIESTHLKGNRKWMESIHPYYSLTR